MAGTLRDELMAIPGIEGAELDGDGETPAGVRVRLAVDADAETVSREVQRVLAAHGMRSQLTGPRVEPAEPPPPPGAPAPPGGSVVALPSVAEVELEARPPEPAAVPHPDQPAATALDSVGVEEGRDGVTVRVAATDGRTAVARAQTAPGGVDEAVVAAVAELTAGAAARLVGVQETVVDGSVVLTVVVELVDRVRRAGSAVSEGGRPYGVARAAWKAFTSPD